MSDGRPMITSVPGILNSAPCIAGTRIPVSAIQSLSEGGYQPEEIRDEFPTLTMDQVRAALSYTIPSPPPPVATLADVREVMRRLPYLDFEELVSALSDRHDKAKDMDDLWPMTTALLAFMQEQEGQ